MVVLHLLSNWKWTERSEPSALLARAQQVAGLQVHFVCDRAPEGVEGTVPDRVRAMGLHVVPIGLPKHLHIGTLRYSIRELREQIERLNPDVIHCHMSGAHICAALACRRLKRAPLLIRSCYDPDGREFGLRERLARRPAADGMIVITDAARQRLVRRRIDPDRIAIIEPGIDRERFMMPVARRDESRKRWQLTPDAFVIGMVTRIRRARGTHLAVALLAALRHKLPQARVLLVGRGSEAEIRRSVTGRRHVRALPIA